MNIENSLKRINNMDMAEFNEEFTKCCGSQAWVNAMYLARPFQSKEELLTVSDSIWEALSEKDYLEAFEHHPQIGDLQSLKEKFNDTAHLAGEEQSGTAEAEDEVLKALQAANQMYLNKFDFIFIVCATGKSAKEMLLLLNDRMNNDRPTEIKNAADEQSKITDLRLYKLLKKISLDDNDNDNEEHQATPTASSVSDITTHVLDTALGCPASGIPVTLEYMLSDGSWHEIASGITDDDGRIMNWMKDKALPGHYKISFDVHEYHSKEGFFPIVGIDFEVKDASQHYHVPLLLSPFSYSTYRGS